MDKPPIFGPNGSVLNSETMSDELREEYRNASRGPCVSAKNFLAVIPFLAIGALIMSAMIWIIRSDIIPHPWMDFFTTAIIAMWVVWITLSVILAAYNRWRKRL